MGFLKDMGGWFKAEKPQPAPAPKQIPPRRTIEQRTANSDKRQELDELRAQKELNELRKFKADQHLNQLIGQVTAVCKLTGQNPAEVTAALRTMTTEQRDFMSTVFTQIQTRNTELSEAPAEQARIFPDQLAKAAEAAEAAEDEIWKMDLSNYDFDDETGTMTLKPRQ